MTRGGCLCGAVQFEVSEFSSPIFKCHCSLCRKAFGGASSSATVVNEDAFRWVAGSETIKQYTTPSGFMRFFCASCGSLLPQFLPDFKLQWIPVGLLDSDPGVPLKHHIHVGSKAPWEVLDEKTKRLDQGFS
ncbi:MAG: hypothetical protein ACI9JM_001521 [Halioglobus sp.]|jgi:hypothetical protein